MNPIHGITSLFWLTVGLGALYMFLKNPAKANALIAAGPATVGSLVGGLEEKGKLAKSS